MVDNTEHPTLDAEGEWRYEYGAIYSDKGRIILADRENPNTRPYERDEMLATVVADHNSKALLVEALRNIRADCQTAAERQTSADWDFAVVNAIDYATAALEAAGIEEAGLNIPCSSCGKPTTRDEIYGDLCYQCCRAENE